MQANTGYVRHVFCYTFCQSYPQVLKITADVGLEGVKSLPLLNAGNIPVTVTLDVLPLSPQLFTLQPSSLTLQPGETADVRVKLHPKHNPGHRLER